MNLARLILGKNQKAAFDTLMLQSVTVQYCMYILVTVKRI